MNPTIPSSEPFAAVLDAPAATQSTTAPQQVKRDAATTKFITNMRKLARKLDLPLPPELQPKPRQAKAAPAAKPAVVEPTPKRTQRPATPMSRQPKSILRAIPTRATQQPTRADIVIPPVDNAADHDLLRALVIFLSIRKGHEVTEREALSYALSRATRELLPSGG